MALAKDRGRIVARGGGNLQILQRLPTLWPDFLSAGYLQSTNVAQDSTMVEAMPETGALAEYLEQSRVVRLSSMLMQSSIDEVNLLKGIGQPQLLSARYFGEVQKGGLWQLHTLPVCRLKVGGALDVGKPGLRLIPIALTALKDDTLAYDQPEWITVETQGLMEMNGLGLWVDPRHGYNALAAALLDVSGWNRHGTISANYATMWNAGTTPLYFLRFNGSADSVDFGNVLNDDGSGDFCIEMWLRVQIANGSAAYCLSKKAAATATGAGFYVQRTAGNVITFNIADGANQANASTTTTVLQNVWKHFAVTVDRNGNAQCYLNGAADGSTAAVSGVSTGTNSASLLAAKIATTYGQIDIGAVRLYRWAAGTLPGSAATMISNHFTAERNYYGV